MIAFKKFKELYEKNQKIIVPAFRRARLEDEADKIESCGKFVGVTRCLNCGTREFKYFYRCKSKFCLLCAKARAQLWVARLYEFIRKTILSKVGCIFRLFLFIRSIKGGCKKYFVKNRLYKKNGGLARLCELVLV